jgi:hypothetical protein
MENRDIESEINDFLIAVFLPGILTFVSGWALFRFYLNKTLIDAGLPPMVPQDGFGAISAGYGRFILLIGISVIVTVFSFIVYVRLFKDPPYRATQ